jgi:hypothetical protein
MPRQRDDARLDNSQKSERPLPLALSMGLSSDKNFNVFFKSCTTFVKSVNGDGKDAN